MGREVCLDYNSNVRTVDHRPDGASERSGALLVVLLSLPAHGPRFCGAAQTALWRSPSILRALLPGAGLTPRVLEHRQPLSALAASRHPTGRRSHEACGPERTRHPVFCKLAQNINADPERTWRERAPWVEDRAALEPVWGGLRRRYACSTERCAQRQLL